jgi:hypothetical protein
MKRSVYIETTIVSYLTSRTSRDVVVAGRQATTADWWNTHRHKFDLFISAIVLTEAEVGDPQAVKRRIDALQGISALEVSEAAKILAHKLTHGGPMPNEYPEDALHIAICALNGIDYMLTWNCSHMANATMRRQVEQFLEAEDYVCPMICTPEELMED